jgi:hypothetical protein
MELKTLAFEKCIAMSKRIRWDIERDVIRGRSFDFTCKFLPDSLSMVEQMPYLSGGEKILMSQVQGRTYANMLALVERFISAKMLQMSHDHCLGDQSAMEATLRFVDEEIKHQKLFHRIEQLAADQMPSGYVFMQDSNAAANFVLTKSTWAVLALTCHVEHFTQTHYRMSIEPSVNLSELYQDVFLYHWREEAQHAIVGELEWVRIDGELTAVERDAGVDDLIALIGGIDCILRIQAMADAQYFMASAKRRFSYAEKQWLKDATLCAYRHQYILSDINSGRFRMLLTSLTTPTQIDRFNEAILPIMVSSSDFSSNAWPPNLPEPMNSSVSW